MSYPENTIQGLSDDWWVEHNDKNVNRGDLIFAFISHVDQIPYSLSPSRANPESHKTATATISQLHAQKKIIKSDLPVAAMPLHNGEVWVVSRAKFRPCLVIGTPITNVDKGLTKGMPNRSTSNTLLVAPFYGVDKYNGRAGYNSKFIEKVQYCFYPQFFWDKLPLIKSTTTESILRLDHIQPIGNHYNSYKHSGFRLHEDALNYIDELTNFNLLGKLKEDGKVNEYIQIMQEFFK